MFVADPALSREEDRPNDLGKNKSRMTRSMRIESTRVTHLWSTHACPNDRGRRIIRPNETVKISRGPKKHDPLENVGRLGARSNGISGPLYLGPRQPLL